MVRVQIAHTLYSNDKSRERLTADSWPSARPALKHEIQLILCRNHCLHGKEIGQGKIAFIADVKKDRAMFRICFP